MNNTMEQIHLKSKEISNHDNLRPLTTNDYAAWDEIAESAWGIHGINQPWDFTALVKDNHVSLALAHANIIKGASVNILKVNDDGTPYLLVHMLGVHKLYQNKGVGKQLMDANYALIREGKAAQAETIKLTSDPMDTRNVRLYLHKCRMHASTYLPDAYQGLSTQGGEKHIGLPSDRLYYQCHPKSLWVSQGILPSPTEYTRLIDLVPDVQKTTSQLPIILVETPMDLVSLKNKSLDEAIESRITQRTSLTSLFDHKYTAVDHAITSVNGISRHHIVCMQGFDENNTSCLINQIQSTIHAKEGMI